MRATMRAIGAGKGRGTGALAIPTGAAQVRGQRAQHSIGWPPWWAAEWFIPGIGSSAGRVAIDASITGDHAPIITTWRVARRARRGAGNRVRIGGDK